MVPSITVAVMLILTSNAKNVKKQFEVKRRRSRAMSLVVYNRRGSIHPMYHQIWNSDSQSLRLSGLVLVDKTPKSPMYTNSFSVIEIEGGAGFTDQAITIILEPFRIRILVSFSEIRKIWRGLGQVGGLLSS